jgi:hypothetical protein
MFGVCQFGVVGTGGLPNIFTLPSGGGSKRIRTLNPKLRKDEIVVNDSLMDALHDYYGDKEGEEVYLNMLVDNKRPFKKGFRTAGRHGHLKIYKMKYYVKK